MANISRIELPNGNSYDLRDNSKATAVATSVTIAVADWSSNNQATKTVSGVTASNSIIVTYAPSSKDAYVESDVYCSAQGSNSLTFTCAVKPTVSVTANVMIIS